MEASGQAGVNILDPKELLRFAQDTTDVGRMCLAGAVSDFFKSHDLNDSECKLAGNILMNLLRQAETDLRAALADRLAVQDNVPGELIVFLANDEISIAAKVLSSSPVLKDIDLLQVIGNRGQEHWRAVARRPGISPIVADRLIDTRDPGTILNLIDNQRTVLQKASVRKLVRVAMTSEELQAPLLRRPEITTDVAIDLYMIVAQGLRKEIIGRFPVSQASVDTAMEALLQELAVESRGRSSVSPEMAALARRFAERGEITPDLMIKTLRRGQTGFFITLFAQRVGISPDGVVKMIRKDGGRAFIVACRSTGMMKSEFASIFLLSRGIRTGDKIVDQRELAVALKYYDSLKDFDVSRIVRNWVKDPGLL